MAEVAYGAGGASVAATMSPRETSMSLSSRSTTDWPATARSSGPSSIDGFNARVGQPRQDDFLTDADSSRFDLARVSAVSPSTAGADAAHGGSCAFCGRTTC